MDRHTITKEEIAKGYDAIAEVVGVGGDFYDDCISIHNRYDGSILDVGCGRGLLIQKVKARAEKGTKFYGVDISPKLCEIARKNNPNATVVVGDAEALPFPDNMFTIVFMTEALEHMLDFGKALSEVSRVLRPGGTFIVTVPNRDWASYDFYDKIRNHEFQPIDDHYFRFNEITELVTEHSLKVLRYRGMDNLYYYGWKHSVEEVIAFFLPFLHKKMKRLVFKCRNEK